jgi:hypothetical protein
MKVLGTAVLLLGALAGCGKIATIEVVGNPTLTITVDIEKLEKYFRPYCTQLLAATNPTDDEVSECVATTVTSFLAAFQGLGN